MDFQLGAILWPLIQAALTLLLTVLPAWCVARRLPVDPLTRLALAAVAGVMVQYLLGLGAYVAGVPLWVAALPLVGLSAHSVADQAIHRGEPLPWGGLAAWFALTSWILALQSPIVVYGGAGWAGDWLEHYQRSLHFLDHRPAGEKFIEIWTVPARAPAFNAAAAVLMGALGRDFASYQVIATVFNTFLVLPLALLVRDRAAPDERRALLWAGALLALAPVAVQQETYVWTKSLAFGFVLLGIQQYAAGRRAARPMQCGWSFLLFTAATLVHFLSVLFAVFFFVHWAWCAVRERAGWRHVVAPAAACALLLATWFGYSLSVYGWSGTMAANSSLGGYRAEVERMVGKPLPSRAGTFGVNLVTTAVPASWRHGFSGFMESPSTVQSDSRSGPRHTPPPEARSRVMEWYGDLYNAPCSVLGALGWAGLLGLGWCLARFGRGARSGLGAAFWIAFCAGGAVLHLAVVAEPNPLGIVQLSLMPYVLLIFVEVVRGLQSSRVVVRAAFIGLFLVESLVGSSALVAFQSRALPMKFHSAGQFAVTGFLAADAVYVNNYALKLTDGLSFLSDRLGDAVLPFAALSAGLAVALLAAGVARACGRATS